MSADKIKLTKLYEEALGTKQIDGVIVANYKEHIVQVKIEKDSVVILTGRVLPENFSVPTDIIKNLNEIDTTGDYSVQKIANDTNCYIYSGQYNFHNDVTKAQVTDSIETNINKAVAGYRFINDGRENPRFNRVDESP